MTSKARGGVQAGEVEQRARELLRHQYIKRGYSDGGATVRVDSIERYEPAAFSAIVTALSQQPEAHGEVDVEAIRSLAADMMTVVSEVDDIGALGSHVVAFVNRLNALTGERNG